MRIIRNNLVWILLPLFLVACRSDIPEKTQAQLLAEQKAKCSELGFRPGTDPFAGCLLELHKQHLANLQAEAEWQSDFTGRISQQQHDRFNANNCHTYGNCKGY